jgi:tRNA/tmRNA/rRNA uracil-C5-methylase (TrmA/RlmC/RlmD family)
MSAASALHDDQDATVGEETPDGTAWRTRVSLHVDDDGRAGPFAARSHRVIAVTDHPLVTPELEAAALELHGMGPGRVDLVQPADGRVRVIPRPRHEHRGRHDRRRGHDRGRPRPERAPGPAPGHEVVVERAMGRDFHVDAGGFWQVHRLAAHSLTKLVAERLEGLVDPDAHHLDLYGGVGLFAVTLAEAGGSRVTTVESDARATGHAAGHLAEWPEADAKTGRVDRWLEQLVAEASDADREPYSRGVVLLDPPRAGAGREIVQAVTALAPSAVAYVACDPVALARDLATFRAAGYETDRIDALDLFPNSHHVEALAVLRPRGSLSA